MSAPTYTTEQIFRHMTPSTMSAWIADMDSDPESLEVEDFELMRAAISELFALVGMEAVSLLQENGVSSDNPLVMVVIESYNEDGE